ncbi:hypothetical protein NDU88_002804 [Pleurodeles waltl]|uniref:Uncharacterized protein n=1 Tax=Pleurodeles waltl TaxID=8319 RepID=A0AAV7Q9W9_PLEWA|nr:hypothetical protein NDU88_002804 [Pleurodeles waltl]
MNNIYIPSQASLKVSILLHSGAELSACDVRTQEDTGVRSEAGAEEERNIAAAAVGCRGSGVTVSRGIVAGALVPPLRVLRGKREQQVAAERRTRPRWCREEDARKTPQGAAT